ncbi:YbgA family protein [Anaeromyxobacter diazotrophicus]|uniref:YbgA family protein n=1 Tax=Anaeromyxobacter diazotrophicus TaxID=2590199 RepID=UPI0015900435|nr:DUF523 and DUF1722 domain-containing protein [Anaeromyxobacter diazotrophicus]
MRRGGARREEPAGARGPLRLGVSACLLGQNVRYDGGHKRNDFLTGLLARFVEFVPVCPEVELGLGTPREAIRLVRDGGLVRLVGRATGADHTAAMRRLAERRVAELARLDLDGYVLKKDSPSCGMERVKVYGGAVATKDGRGAFAAVLLDRLPLLPVEEEGRLQDLPLREAFVERLFAYRRLKALFAGRWALGELVAFHAAEKLLLLAHEPAAYQQLGRLVAGAKGIPRAELARRYGERYLRALAKPATRGRHVNVLQHMAGYLKDLAAPGERQELQEAIADYRQGLVPLVVPVTLLRHHVRRHGIAYLAGQRYLEPHPKELMLRNHA